MTPRGIANNNPGNIRSSNVHWFGLSDVQGDSSFLQFSDPIYGIRAMALIQLNYQGRGVVTVRDRIDTWAPSEENDDGAYEADVCNRMAVTPLTKIDVTNQAMMEMLLRAIIWHENGEQPYTLDQFTKAINMAYQSHALTAKPSSDSSSA
jgi:hypothetical protein